MRDFSERQSQLFFLIGTFLVSYEPPELQPLIDDDVAEGGGGAGGDVRNRRARRHLRASSGLAARRAARDRAEAGAARRRAAAVGSAFERDAAVVLRRVEEARARGPRGREPDNRRAFLELLGRVIRTRRPVTRRRRRATPAPAEPRA